ncbi:MAG: glycosyltransferase family 4 protein [Pedobacter sp.]|uniref:glycosyltransferase family 4 protein n=1 Tax=Pedobacter sp. TaxID=1411316 RepID=UPI002807CA20|nr:glycosyltransferase family 4 protein [Pedobacter sp.]MDQ8004882.1 glycosyltransferase family 4 protein [Pedobacter sp.]
MQSPNITIVHPGTQHSPHLARELYNLNLLKYYVTSLGFAKNSYLEKVVKSLPILNRRLSLRFFDGLPNNKIKTYPLPELQLLLKKKVNPLLDVRKEINKRNEKIQLSVSKDYIKESDIIIGYDTSSWIIAQRAKDMGKTFILDQTTCHSKTKSEYITRLRKEYPEWYNDTFHENKSILLAQEKLEHDLADLIVVPSRFVKNSLTENGVDSEKILINPYGINNQQFKDINIRNYRQKLVFLFVGSINANKGVPDLLKVWTELKLADCELWVAGYGNLPEKIKPLHQSINFLGKIDKNKLPNIYNEAHVFIFPSYFEGLAQVQIEALSCGLPVVGTYNSGATELIIAEENGLVIEAGNIGELKNAIIWFNENKNKLSDMSRKSKIASANQTWENYGNRWKHIIENHI